MFLCLPNIPTGKFSLVSGFLLGITCVFEAGSEDAHGLGEFAATGPVLSNFRGNYSSFILVNLRNF